MPLVSASNSSDYDKGIIIGTIKKICTRWLKEMFTQVDFLVFNFQVVFVFTGKKVWVDNLS